MSRQLLTPSPSPPPPVPTPTLSAQINAATRKQHTELNRLIVDHLPLGLPPKASDPHRLGRGLAAFAAIFFVFEACWQELNDSVENDGKELTGTHDSQTRRWLSTLRPPELPRSSRLRQDLEYISHRTGRNISKLAFLQPAVLENTSDEIRDKPHILLAYGWVMYMAIFSGGRWIRQQLLNAGMEYWIGDTGLEPDKKDLQLFELPGFSFLYFDSPDDGESTKALFKARLAEAEILLTQQERQDVIAAAQVLFTRCNDLVHMIEWTLWWEAAWKKVTVLLVSIMAVVLLLVHLWQKHFQLCELGKYR